MSDGNRLEGVGVIPDIPIGPTNKALFNKSDPVLSYAAQLFGTQISPEAAGGLYFLNEKPEEKEEIATDDEKTEGY